MVHDPTKTVHRSRYILWILGSPFAASFWAFLICAAVSIVEFILFDGPLKEDMGDIFPVSQYTWLPLLFVISAVGPQLFLHQLNTRRFRQQYYNSFCEIAARTMYPGQLMYAYVYVHRGRSKTPIGDAFRKFDPTWTNAGGTESIKEFIQINVPDLKTREKLLRFWYDAEAIEQQNRPIIIYALAYVSTWLFCLTVPILYYSYYGWPYGAFGLIATWVLLALCYGPTVKVNQFDNFEVSHFIVFDYERDVDERVKFKGLKKT